MRSCGRGQSCRDAVCLSLAPRKVFWVRDTGAGEGAGVPRRLEGGGGGCGGPLGAAQVPIVELPEQLLVLHGEALVDLGLLLQRLLQDRLLRGKLPGRQKGARNHVSLFFFFFFKKLKQNSYWFKFESPQMISGMKAIAVHRLGWQRNREV